MNGFGGEGIFLFCVDDWRVMACETHDDAEYGIFPSHSVNGRIDHSFASGAHDTASPGCSRWRSSWRTSVSKMCAATIRLEFTLV